jgi:hypothetical protein
MKVFLAVAPPFTEATSATRSGDLALGLTRELRPYFVRVRLNLPLVPLASLYVVLAMTTDAFFVTIRLPTFFLIFRTPVIRIDPEHVATLQLALTEATGVDPDSTREVDAMTTLGLEGELFAAAATPFEPLTMRMNVPTITLAATDIRAAQARAFMNVPPGADG